MTPPSDPHTRLPTRLRAVRLRLRDALSQAPLARIRSKLAAIGGKTSGNQLTFFHDGDDFFDALLAAIARATDRVWLETYILEPDAVGVAILDALRSARQRGVEVVLLVDAVGSSTLTEAQLQPLRDAGASVVVFNPLWRLRGLLPRVVRDHRKITLVDGVGFCGGMNISVDYAGHRRGNGRFLDAHTMVQGPCISLLERLFLSSLRLENRALARRHRPRAAPAPLALGVNLQVLESDIPRGKRQIQRALYEAMGHAQRTCCLTTPYFVPPWRMLRAMVRARQRGVDVRIITAGLSDVPLIALAAQHLYGKLLRAGVRIFELHTRTLHKKTAVVDDAFAVIGSFNLDRWSFHRNLEVALLIDEPDVAQHLAADFSADVASATEVTLEQWQLRSRWQRVRCALAYWIAQL